MGFWNYVGLACLINTLFGRKKHYNTGHTSRCYDPMREAERNARFDELSDRINALDHRLDGINPDSELYDEFDTEIRNLRDGLCDLYDDDDDLLEDDI